MKTRLRSGANGLFFSQCCSPLFISTRYYFWPYNEDFVPKGAKTSSFQSSPSPVVRQQILREYALSPLFGTRLPCCTLGTMRTAREMIKIKKEISQLLCEVMQVKTGTVYIGPLIQMTEMMLFKAGTPLSPRLGDDRHSNLHAYGRKPVVARTLMDVFLPEEFAPDDVLSLGHFVRGKLLLAFRDNKGSQSYNNNNNVGNETNVVSSEMDKVRLLVNIMGISHCEVPQLDESGFVFDAVGGELINNEEAERILRRWEERGE